MHSQTRLTQQRTSAVGTLLTKGLCNPTVLDMPPQCLLLGGQTKGQSLELPTNWDVNAGVDPIDSYLACTNRRHPSGGTIRLRRFQIIHTHLLSMLF